MKTTKDCMLKDVIVIDTIGGFYCCTGIIYEIVDRDYVMVSFFGGQPYYFHRSELMLLSDYYKTLEPSIMTFHELIGGIQSGRLGGGV